MSFKEKINSKIDEGFKALDSAFLSPVQSFALSWQEYRSKNKQQAYIILGVLFLFTILVFSISFKVLTQNQSQNSNPPSQNSKVISQNTPQSEIGGSEQDSNINGEKRAKLAYLNFFNGFVPLFGEYFGQYVFTTVDPSGLSTIDSSGGGVTFDPRVNSDTKLQMGSNSFLYSTIRYSNTLLAIVAPIMAVLVAMSGLQLIMNSNNSSQYSGLSERIQRLLLCGVMVFLITPTLLSVSVMATQLLNNQILSLVGTQNTPECVGRPKSDTECIFRGITDQILIKTEPKLIIPDATNKANGEIEIAAWDVGGIINYPLFTVGGFIKLIPTIILTLIILVLFVVILIQFVMRYLNLYFLFVIYPIVAVFWFNPSTSKFYSEYWKQIITLLIQQPVFLLCFAIFIDMTTGLSTNLSPSNLLIYAVFLGFMTVVPATLSARIFGDAFAMADHLGFAQSKNYFGQKVQQAKNLAYQKSEKTVGKITQSIPKFINNKVKGEPTNTNETNSTKNVQTSTNTTNSEKQSKTQFSTITNPASTQSNVKSNSNLNISNPVVETSIDNKKPNQAVNKQTNSPIPSQSFNPSPITDLTKPKYRTMQPKARKVIKNSSI